MNKMCFTHPQYPVVMIDMRSDHKRCLFCTECIKENDMVINQLTDIKDVLDYYQTNQQSIFQETQVFTQLKQMIEQSEQIEKQIKLYFDNFCSDILKKLDNLLEKQQLKTSKLKQQLKGAKYSYQEKTSVNQLQEILKSQNSNVEQELSQCVQNYYTSFSELEFLENRDQLSIFNSSFSLNQANEAKNQILSLLDSIQFFNKLNLNNNHNIQSKQSPDKAQNNVLSQKPNLKLAIQRMEVKDVRQYDNIIVQYFYLDSTSNRLLTDFLKDKINHSKDAMFFALGLVIHKKTIAQICQEISESSSKLLKIEITKGI